MMVANATQLLAVLSQRAAGEEAFEIAFTRGNLTVEMYAPRGIDKQSPHDRDELYCIHQGEGRFIVGDQTYHFVAGMMFMIPAGVRHRFINFSDDFATWVIFYGPVGGELPVTAG